MQKKEHAPKRTETKKANGRIKRPARNDINVYKSDFMNETLKLLCEKNMLSEQDHDYAMGGRNG